MPRLRAAEPNWPGPEAPVPQPPQPELPPRKPSEPELPSPDPGRAPFPGPGPTDLGAPPPVSYQKRSASVAGININRAARENRRHIRVEYGTRL